MLKDLGLSRGSIRSAIRDGRTHQSDPLPVSRKETRHDHVCQRRNPCPSRRPPHGPDKRRRRGADLSDDLLPVPRHRTCGQSFRAEGTRPHLQPHHESDERCAGAENGGARRRRGRHGGEFRPGGNRARRAEHLPCRRQHRGLDRYLWRNLEPLRPHLQDHGHRGALCRSSQPGSLPHGNRQAHPRLLCRILAQPEACRVPHRRSGGVSAANSACR